jgi:hypothetical protein
MLQSHNSSFKVAGVKAEGLNIKGKNVVFLKKTRFLFWLKIFQIYQLPVETTCLWRRLEDNMLLNGSEMRFQSNS